MVRVFALLALLLAWPSLAQDQGVPKLNPGDSWEYDVVAKRDPSGNHRFSLTVRSMSGTDYVVDFKNISSGASDVWVLSPDLNPMHRPNRNVPRQERKWMSWPPQAGKTWTYSYTVPGSGGNVRYDMEAKIEGEEEVVVKAGKFDTVRIVTSGSYTREWDGRKGSVKETIWFAPKVRQRVKYSFAQTDIQGMPFDDNQVEMVGYTLK